MKIIESVIVERLSLDVDKGDDSQVCIVSIL